MAKDEDVLAVGVGEPDEDRVTVPERPKTLAEQTAFAFDRQFSMDVIDEPRTVMGLPMAAFVRGGTTSSRHDRFAAEQHLDAEARRNDADAAKERELARTPLEQGGGVMFGGRFLPAADAGGSFVLLVYLNPKGEVLYESGEEFQCLADLTVLEGGELCLVIVCPACLTRGVHHDQCQMRVRQTNKHFEFSTKGAGDLIVFKEYDHVLEKFVEKVYKSAGTIVESERFRCDQCGWTARIVNNRVRPDA